MSTVTEPEARAAYLAMTGRRSLRRLNQEYTERKLKAPSVQTLKEWSRKNNWAALAKQHDAKVATSAGDKIATDQVETAVRRSKVYRDLAEKAAEKALAAANKIDPDKLKASDIRALAEVSERAGKMSELLEGRATERNETVTR